MSVPALILAAMVASTGVVVGPNTVQKYMSQREGEPLVKIESWEALRCAEPGKNIAIRLLPEQKTVAVSCE